MRQRTTPARSVAPGETIPLQGEPQDRVPRAPHERDESAASQAPASADARAQGRRGHADAALGQPDTDKGPVLDATYQKLRQGTPGERKR